MHTTKYTKAAARRNDIPHHGDDQSLKPVGTFLPIGFPAARLIERLTHRPSSTCAVLAAAAGYRELEAQ